MAKLNSYLTFNNTCKEAMTFYKECVGGELTFTVVEDSPVASQVPPQMQKSILHSCLKTDEFEIMATDMAPEGVKEGNDVHLCLICKNEQEARTLFDKLSAGGKVKQPLQEMFFGFIGTLEDKFGKRWMLECDKAN